MAYEKLFSRYVSPLMPLPTGFKPKGTPEKDVACVLFDIYGTLFISGSGDIGLSRRSPRKTSELQALLEKYDIRKDPGNFLKSFFSAVENRHAELRRDGNAYPEVRIERIWAQVMGTQDSNITKKFAIEFELMVNPVYPMPHLGEMISTLRDRKIPLGLISNAQFYTPHLFEWFLGSTPEGLGFDKELIFYSFRFECAKPSPVLFEKALEKILQRGLTGDRTLYVGNDMRNDICPAARAGFQTALFAGDARSLRLRTDDPGCRNGSPDLVVTNLLQIVDFTGLKQPRGTCFKPGS